MKESTLRKLVLLLLLSTIICLLWAAGANSRKRVELEKSKDLNAKLEKLTLANTVITGNLKTIQNKIASLQQKEYELKNNLQAEEKAKEDLRSKLEVTQTGHEQTLEELKNANTMLGEELTRLKEKELSQRQELERLNDLEQTKAKKQVVPEANKTIETKKPETTSSGNNFAW
jgi:predicted nuclease with TOPRIM domain